ncbi:hypothetical protein C2E21_3490 [Chlorella sorokiniana]|uniref:Uncharacterized protein n=1 Tax=Chlorella sorokiniana TaxID=3076 RepID=A0A2P6TUQ7_CHLSO|nr:hypothetical protein C2E21_3490 [Chlorella sorokiniana]|eukprot:PRW57776.1 hypothetical protein C2E21_3490 [Chlorella sorokiniana]
MSLTAALQASQTWRPSSKPIPRRSALAGPVAARAAAAAPGEAPEQARPRPASRRVLLSGAAALLAAAAAAPAAQAVPVPPAPATGDCPECIGEVNETLNACTLDSVSCTSTLNDDEGHFAAPWQFDGDRDAAVARLLEVVTGGNYELGLIESFGGIKQTDAAVYIAKGVLAVATGGDMPEQPKRQRKSAAQFVPFDGEVIERRTTAGGAEYIRVVLGTKGGAATDVEDPSAVIDAEFLFLSGDNLVNIRASSRAEPEGRLGSGGQLALSLREGFVIDRNVARREMERLRTALNWELAPVIADFSPAFNAEAPTIFDKVFDPWNRRNQFQPSGVAYPAEGGK